MTTCYLEFMKGEIRELVQKDPTFADSSVYTMLRKVGKGKNPWKKYMKTLPYILSLEDCDNVVLGMVYRQEHRYIYAGLQELRRTLPHEVLTLPYWDYRIIFLFSQYKKNSWAWEMGPMLNLTFKEFMA